MQLYQHFMLSKIVDQASGKLTYRSGGLVYERHERSSVA